MSPTSPVRRVVFVGGGYATLHAYRTLVHRRRRALRRGDLEVVVLSADDHHSFHGFTGEVLAGTLPVQVTRADLRRAMPHATVLSATVIHVDAVARVVTFVRPGGAPETLRYDELAVGCGGCEPVADVPGMREHGFTLRSPGDLQRLLTRLALLEHPAAGRGPADLVVVGGGFAGVELAAALAARPTAVTGRRVQLVHSGTALLPALRDDRPRLARQAERELSRLGVEVRCGVRVQSVGRRHVLLSDGRLLPAALVLATTGQRAVPIDGLESLPTDEGGRLLTTSALAVAPGLWAAGDAARVAHPRTAVPVPANALWAIKAGAHVGRNLARTLDGREPTAFRYLGLGQAAAFGVGRGIAELYGVPLTGRVAWVARLAFFLRFMPSRRNAAASLAFLATGRSAVPCGAATSTRRTTAPAAPAGPPVPVSAAGAPRSSRAA